MFISVALCTYNGQQFLNEQLQSIFSQTVPVNEIIICDEGSIDNTLNIINSFRHTHPNIIELQINEQKLGVVKNFEKAVMLCKGDVIFFSDQDDVWEKDKVNETISFFNTYPQFDAVFSDASLVDDSTEELGKTMWEIIQFKEVANNNPGVNILKHLIFHGNVVTGACLAIRKEAKDLILPFKQIGELYHDEYIALKLAEFGKIAFLNKPLIKYRLHANQQSKAMRHESRTEANSIKQQVIKGNVHFNPLEYYRYWKRRIKAIGFLKSNGINIRQEFIGEIESERKRGLIAYYKTFGYYKRKKALLHALLKGKENVSLNDVLVK